MAIARFKDLCLDAVDTTRAGTFWAEVLGLTWVPEAGEERLTGPTPQHTIWINEAPEGRVVKNRVHFDLYALSLAGLEALGSAVVRPQTGDEHWTVMADPEGGEFCAFLREELPADRLHGLVVDSADAAAQATWWGMVYGADVVHNQRGWSTLENVPGMPILTMDFSFVPEAKTVKNRVHWDVNVDDLQPLMDAGAKLLRPADDEIGWNVMADPEGNEFCAFVPADTPQ
jgi:hypothetical protein